MPIANNIQDADLKKLISLLITAIKLVTQHLEIGRKLS